MQRSINAKTIEKELFDAIEQAKTSEPSSGQIAAETTAAVNVAILSLDLDNFKQVNDSYGHDYGDIVLMCFANRLEHIISELQQEHTNTQLTLGRSGGEEFLVVVSGALTEQSVEALAERVRSGVGSDVLPNDREWAGLPKERLPTGLILPHVAERRITTSVGISSVASPASTIETRSLSANLRREADAALYRAKAGGRNVVRFFPAIRARFGTILEHHADTGIVVIDIGSHVNIQPGHEFHVFHPDFTGDKAFIFSDGRSHKRLGTYPRYSAGRIVVFDAQKEISFCHVAEIRGLPRFPIGSVLQFIPIGSITHLISMSGTAHSLNAVRLSPPEQIEMKAANKKVSHIAIVFTLLNLNELEASRGVAFVNQSLATLFREIEQQFHPCAVISQIGPAMLAVFLPLAKAPDHEALVTRVIEQAETRCAGIPCFGAGIYHPRNTAVDGDKSDLSAEYALDYARYAAAFPGLEQKKIETFSAATASAILTELRSKKRDYAEVIADYHRMKERGINYTYVENNYALSCLAISPPDLEAGLAAARRAYELKSDDCTLIANLATFEFATGHPTEAYRLFAIIPTLDPKYSLSLVYFSVQAMAAFEQYETDPTSVDRNTVISLLRRANGAHRPVNIAITPETIKLALDQIMDSQEQRLEPTFPLD